MVGAARREVANYTCPRAFSNSASCSAILLLQQQALCSGRRLGGNLGISFQHVSVERQLAFPISRNMQWFFFKKIEENLEIPCSSASQRQTVLFNRKKSAVSNAACSPWESSFLPVSSQLFSSRNLFNLLCESSSSPHSSFLLDSSRSRFLEG